MNRPLPADTPPSREGQRPASTDENFSTRSCDRPGCYEVFIITASLAQRRFCSSLCRLALRRVLDREARYRHGGGVGVGNNRPGAGSGRTRPEHVFRCGRPANDGVKCPRPQNGGRSGRARKRFRPPVSFLRNGGSRGGCAMSWNEGVVQPVALAALGQSYRRYRLADPPAEEAMAGSLRRWGQLAPVVACRRGPQLELLDGFKRWTAARAGGRVDDPERAGVGGGRADGEGGDPGTEPRPRRRPRVGGSLDRAGAGARRWADAGGSGALAGPAQELGVSPAGACWSG